MIDQITIDRIIDAAQIEDVVSEFVTLKKRGVNMVGLCPFHSDRTPSFYVSPSKNICKCFSCGEGGSAVHFIMKHEQLSYHEALRFLAKKYSIEIQEKEFTQEQQNAYNERESLFIINDYAQKYFEKTLHEHIEGKSIGLSYFKERGFREDTIKKFQLGYSLEERDAFTQEALRNSFKKEFLVKTGLTIEGDNYTVDRFRGRVMFPVHTISGKIVAFGGRILKKAENTGKYINSPESDIYQKSEELYGIFFAKRAIAKADFCFLVEGYTDVISMHQAGIENVVSSSGTALTLRQIKLIHRFTTNITVLYDGDAAGIKAALRGIDLLLEQGLNVKVVLLPDGEDPDSFARKQNAVDFNNYIQKSEVDFVRFKTQLLLKDAGNDPIKKAALITDIVSSISVIPDNIIRSVYIKDCSILLSIDERVLVDEVNKKRQTHLQNENTRSKIEQLKNSMPFNVIAGVQDSNNSLLDKQEREILYYIIRYGMDPIVYDNEEETQTPMTVLEYVKFDLERDGFWFQTPILHEILDEAIEHMTDADFEPSRYFLAHPSEEISKIAANLLEDKHQLSNVFIKQFGENTKLEDTPLAEHKQLETAVPRVLTELKYVHICISIKETQKKMGEVDIEASTELMKQFKELKEIKAMLEKVLGERVVLRW